MKREPNFDNMLAVLNRKVPDRPTLYELFLNGDLFKILCKGETFDQTDPNFNSRITMRAYYHAGYDYVNMTACNMTFPRNVATKGKSISQNEVCMIDDQDSFERYQWPDPDTFDYSGLEVIGKELPGNMKIITYGPGGVLENVTDLMGFDNMCYMLVDDPDLLGQIFDRVGTALYGYYSHALEHDPVGAIMLNDDWGFVQSTMLSTADMRKYVFPWHKKIIELAHQKGRPVLLHSCGNLKAVWEDMIEDMKFDAKHSFEDKIEPVEQVYEQYSSRIAILGGIDVDFCCRASKEDITRRAAALLERSADRGGYALGSGNSIPAYVPPENYFAMIKAAVPDLKIDV